MSSKTRRWFCRECKREWVDPEQSNETGGMYANSWRCSITGNPPGKNCPICGSPEIELIEFTPLYPGLDIPRDGTIERIPIENVGTIPGLTGHNDYQITRETIPEPISKEEPSVETQMAAVVATMEENNSIFDLSDMD